jgi:predicted DNA-binding ArsR family transcriptional regulator
MTTKYHIGNETPTLSKCYHKSYSEDYINFISSLQRIFLNNPLLETKIEQNKKITQVKKHNLTRVASGNILGFGVTKIEEIYVCIAFMHRKSGKFSRFQIKPVIVTEVSLELME